MTLSATVLLAVSSLAQTPAPPLPPALPGAAVAPAQPGSGPRILFADTIHDFGTLSAGDVRRCDFVFTNTGNTVLEVTEVRPTCGCTTAAEWSRRVEPGQTGKIPLQLNTANFQGPVVKFVTIVCNDPAQPNHQLQLKANIWKPIDVAPNFVMFNLNNESQTNEVRVVKITNNTPQPIEISPPEVGNPAFRAEIKAIEPGKVFELHIHPTAPFSPGTVQTTITAKTTSTNMPVVTVTALSMVQPPVVAVPQQIYLPPGPLANAMPMTVLIQNNTAEPITISDAAITLENVSVKVTESQPGKVFSLTLTFPQGFELPAGRPGTLTAKTSHPKVPQITVPVVQPPRPNTVFSTPTRTFNAVPPPPESLRAPPTLPRVPPTPPPTHTLFTQPTPPPLQRVPPTPPTPHTHLAQPTPPPTPPPATPPGH